MIKKNKLKKIFEIKGFRISTENLKKISLIIENQTDDIVEKIIRNAKISGRKTIKPEDIKPYEFEVPAA